MLGFMLLGACNAGAESGSSGKPAPVKPVMLAIHSYNYTDRYIDQFTVNGTGGGNVSVSSPTAGGGKTTCCVAYVPGAAVMKVQVRWVSGGCTFTSRNMYNEESKHTRYFYKVQDVTVDPKVPAQPESFEVHFYQDGHVEAAIADDYSPPRLKLREEREIKPTYPQCAGNKDPGPNEP